MANGERGTGAGVTAETRSSGASHETVVLTVLVVVVVAAAAAAVPVVVASDGVAVSLLRKAGLLDTANAARPLRVV